MEARVKVNEQIKFDCTCATYVWVYIMNQPLCYADTARVWGVSESYSRHSVMRASAQCAGNRFLKVPDEIWRWIYHWGVWWNRCLFPYEWLADLDAISERTPRFSICTIRDVLAHGRWLDECIRGQVRHNAHADLRIQDSFIFLFEKFLLKILAPWADVELSSKDQQFMAQYDTRRDSLIRQGGGISCGRRWK